MAEEGDDGQLTPKSLHLSIEKAQAQAKEARLQREKPDGMELGEVASQKTDYEVIEVNNYEEFRQVMLDNTVPTEV